MHSGPEFPAAELMFRELLWGSRNETRGLADNEEIELVSIPVFHVMPLR